ncbi:MAG: HypC/HybG/HupF family hydrogenase formation chaperone [Actinomycetota bacterium]
MCVSAPGLVLSTTPNTDGSRPARVLMAEGEREVDLVMVPQAREGDYVIVHSGYAVRVVPHQVALDTLEVLGLGNGDRGEAQGPHRAG